MRPGRRILSWCLASLIAATPLAAQSKPGMLGYTDNPPRSEADHANVKPSKLQGVGIDQKIGATLPLDLSFTDTSGAVRPLRDFFQAGQPVVLVPVYFTCPMLCSLVMDGVASALSTVEFTPGKDFQVVVFSINPHETTEDAAKKKAEVLKRYGRPETTGGWHFLVGGQKAISRLTDTIGFHYAYDAEHNQYSHAATILLVTPDGRVARYFYGVEYAPRDLRLGLIDTSKNKLGSVVDQVLLYCFHYDPSTGKYSAAIMNIIRGGGVLTLLAIGLLMLVFWRRGKSTESTLKDD